VNIDKKYDRCAYNNEQHVYWLDNDINNKCVSVTSLISEFVPKFDSVKWSKIKAFEKLVTPEIFKFEKKYIYSCIIFDMKLLDKYNIEEIDFNRETNNILDEWQRKKDIACNRGTKIHKELEELVTGKDIMHQDKMLKHFNLKGDFKCVKENNYFSEEKALYPELLLFYESEDKYLKLAGQADLVIKDGKDSYIVDFKTNNKIETKPHFNYSTKQEETLNFPLNNLKNTTLVKYQLQLSTYAWMIEQMNPELKTKGLVIIHFDHEGDVTNYHLDYLKDDVTRMLNYYRKQIRVRQLKERNKPIEF